MFKKGYTMCVTSWENDGDNYNTIQFHVETLNEVKFWLEWLELFKSGSRAGYPEGFNLGNAMGDGKVKEAYDFTKKLAEKFELSHLVEFEKNEWFNEESWMTDQAYKFMGGSEHYDFRVYESMEVYYFPEDVSPIDV